MLGVLAVVIFLVASHPFAHRRIVLRKDLEAFQGRYLNCRVEKDGTLIPTGRLTPEYMELTGNTLSALAPPSPVRHSTLVIDALDPTKDPPWIDMSLWDGNRKFASYKGVYRYDGDSLIIHFSHRTGDERPLEAPLKPVGGHIALKRTK